MNEMAHIFHCEWHAHKHTHNTEGSASQLGGPRILDTAQALVRAAGRVASKVRAAWSKGHHGSGRQLRMWQYGSGTFT